ncbi:hypothetical protein LEP1GSC133_0953 [Leptospira borgpetersenii serovar Pomona str. 200901868]|uniref:Uncharacterized protein n=1 Tax=Leptospira borgpetersenii serovar Pomona str. 200901868 TaxID=1192866 RepID=M6VT27_LEPBO|nr:hypothetical protein LEP1GSC133_0953 [Leptospira borgpetersenii serovar Pomona str. 200901868]
MSKVDEILIKKGIAYSETKHLTVSHKWLNNGLLGKTFNKNVVMFLR